MKLFLVLLLHFTSNCLGRPYPVVRNINRGYNPEHQDYSYDENGAGVYEKMNDIIYPFQQYIQVRHEYSVEHLPIQEDSEHDAAASTTKNDSFQNKKHQQGKPGNLETSASNPEHGYDNENDNGHHDNEEEHGEEGSYHDHKPRLTEEIDDYKKQEVYEEKGYSDGGYDHGNYATNMGEKYQYHPPEEDNHQEYQNDDNQNDNHHEEEGDTLESTPRQKYVRKQSSKSTNPTHTEPASSSSRNRPRSHLSNLPASTKLLEYANRNMYDKEAHEKGIYAARANIKCPEVIDFNLSSKKMAMGKAGKNPRGSKPRLTGLGGKIKCLKEKYFGVEPLPSQIFMSPSESVKSVIQMPTWDQFYNSVRSEINSISDFQHF